MISRITPTLSGSMTRNLMVAKRCFFFFFVKKLFLPLIFPANISCRCQTKNVPICLMYGKEDPWVKPVWGRKVKQQLPEVPYYEISPAGHCPHDEVPEVLRSFYDKVACLALDSV